MSDNYIFHLRLVNTRTGRGCYIAYPSNRFSQAETLDYAGIPQGSGEYRHDPRPQHAPDEGKWTEALLGVITHPQHPPSVQQLNYLARLIQAMGEEEARLLAEIADTPDRTITQVIETAQSLSAAPGGGAHDPAALAERAVVFADDEPLLRILFQHEDDEDYDEEAGIWVDFPATKHKLNSVAKALGSESYHDLSIAGYDMVLDTDILDDERGVSVDRINDLAKAWRKHHVNRELGKYKAILELEGCDLDEARKLAGKLDKYEFYQGETLAEVGARFQEQYPSFDDCEELGEYICFEETHYGALRRKNAPVPEPEMPERDKAVLETEMDADAFWSIIDTARAAGNSHMEMSENLTKLLLDMDGDSILAFGLIYHKYHCLADKKLLWSAANIMVNGYCSDDGFHYFRSFLISQGRDAYEAALKNPDTLAYLNYRYNIRWELVNYAPVEAYERKTGSDDYYDKRDSHRLPADTENAILSRIRYHPAIKEWNRDPSAFPHLTDLYASPYIPPDGATIRYSVVRLVENGERSRAALNRGHVGLEELAGSKNTQDAFREDIALEAIEMEVEHYTCGNGKTLRDMNDDEYELAFTGQLDKHQKLTGTITHRITREQASVPPPSPLTERGMSLFFTAVANRAEELGFTVAGVDEKAGCLSICNGEKLMFALGENESGSYDFTVCGKKAYERSNTLRNDIHELRASIPEYLYPHDYETMQQWMEAEAGAGMQPQQS